VALVDAVYREYGDAVDVDGYDRDLLDVERHYAYAGGAFVVLEADGEVVGAHAAKPVDVKEGIVTFRRLYVRDRFRGRGAGPALMDWALEWSKEHGFDRVEFWSDTRFTRAHRFFGRYGFVRGEIRHMDEGPLVFSEYRFWGRIS
jgi:putative acetyltransferase